MLDADIDIPLMCAACAEDYDGPVRDTGLGGYQPDPLGIGDDEHAGLSHRAKRRANKQAKVDCPKCGKRVKAVGLQDHIRDKHG